MNRTVQWDVYCLGNPDTPIARRYGDIMDREMSLEAQFDVLHGYEVRSRLTTDFGKRLPQFDNRPVKSRG